MLPIPAYFTIKQQVFYEPLRAHQYHDGQRDANILKKKVDLTQEEKEQQTGSSKGKLAGGYQHWADTYSYKTKTPMDLLSFFYSFSRQVLILR